MPSRARDRFDDVPRATGRVGAHRAENPRMNGWVALLWAAVAAIILVVAGTFAVFVVTGRIQPFPGDGTAAPPPPEETGVIDTSYSVLILNGTPDPGLEARTRDTIVNAGWNGTDVYAGPSGTSSFSVTTIYYVDADDEPAARGLAGVVGGADLEQSDHYANLDDPEERQLTLVLGLDRSAVQPEPAETPEQ